MKPILIVEDEAIMRESLRDWLADCGYQVETAEEGEEALKIIDEQDFGLAILDLRLPGKDGIEVLREARTKRPQLKGIIITAYPSVQTAVEAMREGAVDYLHKPVDLNLLEILIRGTLGPVQVEIKPKAVTEEAVAKPAAVEKAEVEEIIAIAPEEIPIHLKQAKAHFEAGRYREALKEFQTILELAPGNIETRVWIRKINEALTKPQVEAVTEGEAASVAEEVKPKECLWMKMGMVAHRICTSDYNCITCEFDQMMQEKMASGETPELDAALERFKELPGNQRLCRYALKGEVSYRVCTRLFQCATCEFGQMMEDALQQKLAKLAARREALRKKEQKVVVSLSGAEGAGQRRHIENIEQQKRTTATVELDEYGFMLHPETWSKEVAQLLAQEEVIGDLTQDHWKVVDYLRQYFLEFGIVPPVRLLVGRTGFSLQRIYELFPYGLSKGVCKVAGMPSHAAMIQGYTDKGC